MQEHWSTYIDLLNIEAKILLLQLEIPIESVIHAAKWGKKKNMIVILNPAPAKELPDELIQSVDFIMPNESELSLVSSKVLFGTPKNKKK